MFSDPSRISTGTDDSMFSHRPLLVGRQSTQRFPERVQEQFLHRPLPLHRQHVGILQEISVAKHRQNVGKPSFRKLTTEMPVEVTLRTALSNFVRDRCESFGQFRRLVRTKIRPSSIIYRLAVKPAFGGLHCYGAPSTAALQRRSGDCDSMTEP